MEVIPSDVWVGGGGVEFLFFSHVGLLQSLRFCTKEMPQIKILLTRGDS